MSSHLGQSAAGNSWTVGAGTVTIGVPLPNWNENQHDFNCQKVENGWTFQYRSKTYICTDVDDMMDKIKTAMVLDRIDK